VVVTTSTLVPGGDERAASGYDRPHRERRSCPLFEHAGSVGLSILASGLSVTVVRSHTEQLMNAPGYASKGSLADRSGRLEARSLAGAGPSRPKLLFLPELSTDLIDIRRAETGRAGDLSRDIDLFWVD